MSVPAAERGYDHFGVLVAPETELREPWDELDRDPEVELREISEAGTTLAFRFRYLLPQAVEVRYFGGR